MAKQVHLRKRQFLILGTGVEDFWRGYETLINYFVVVRKFLKQLLWGTTNFACKNFG